MQLDPVGTVPCHWSWTRGTALTSADQMQWQAPSMIICHYV
jgi:hypothetical protein